MSFFTGFILGVIGLLLLLVLVGIVLGPRDEARAADPASDGSRRMRVKARAAVHRPRSARRSRAMNAAQSRHVAELSGDAETARSPERDGGS